MVDLKGKKVGIALGIIGIILHNLVLLSVFDSDLLGPVILTFILSYAVISTYLLFRAVECGKKTDLKIRKGFVVSLGTAIVTSILLAYASLGYDHAEIMILMVAFVSSLWITISVYLIALGRSGAKGKNPERKAGVLLIVSPFILGAVALFLLFFPKSPMGYLLRSESSLNLLGLYFLPVVSRSLACVDYCGNCVRRKENIKNRDSSRFRSYNHPHNYGFIIPFLISFFRRMQISR